MYAILLVFVIVAVVVYLIGTGSTSSNSDLIEKIKNGNTDIKTKDPIKDYINLRQIYNFNGEITNKDIETLIG